MRGVQASQFSVLRSNPNGHGDQYSKNEVCKGQPENSAPRGSLWWSQALHLALAREMLYNSLNEYEREDFCFYSPCCMITSPENDYSFCRKEFCRSSLDRQGTVTHEIIVLAEWQDDQPPRGADTVRVREDTFHSNQACATTAYNTSGVI